jgi:arylsulfatase A-like enzyme
VWLLIALVSAVSWSYGEERAPPRAVKRELPNIVLVLMDDMGWRDVGFMGNSFVETPHLDRLAKSGIVFTQAYASAPNCAPTRACLMSGQYPPRHGIYTVVDPRQPPGSPWQKLMAGESKAELAPSVVTIAESLSAGGYATGFFGMWNLGRGRRGPVSPNGQGFGTSVFPEDLGFEKDAYFNAKGGYLSDRLTDEVIDFIQRHREQPFFAYFADHAVHSPFDPKRDLSQKYRTKAARTPDPRNDPDYAATVEAVDQNMGRIIDAVQRFKLTENTVVIFTSDNGGLRQYTSPLRGGKGELFEGGIRVPLLIAGPVVSKPGNKIAAPVASIDLYPTLLDLTGCVPPNGHTLDGLSLAPILSGGQLAERPLFWHFPCYVGRATPSSAVRLEDYKLIEFFEDGGRYELYDLRNDPSELQNLTEKMPDKIAELQKKLKSWQDVTKAAIPVATNPNYTSAAEHPRGNRKSAIDNGRRRDRNTRGSKSQL